MNELLSIGLDQIAVGTGCSAITCLMCGSICGGRDDFYTAAAVLMCVSIASVAVTAILARKKAE